MTALARSIPIEHPETLSLDRYDVKSYRYPGGDMAVRVLFSPGQFDNSFVTVRPKVGTPEASKFRSPMSTRSTATRTARVASLSSAIPSSIR